MNDHMRRRPAKYAKGLTDLPSSFVKMDKGSRSVSVSIYE